VTTVPGAALQSTKAIAGEIKEQSRSDQNDAFRPRD
jgi:hypothetical protein